MSRRRGTIVNTKSLNDGIARLKGKCAKEEFTVALIRAAAFLLSKAAEHAPKDTGTLAGSHTWKQSNPGEVTFGFNTEYAYVQDQGSKKMPCKGYNSEVGPNEYFSGTLERFSDAALKIIAAEVAKIIGK